jgi:hypothetical protein
VDERERSLEREVAAGDRDAEVKLLVERVRRGAISSERVALLAYVDDASAIEYLGSEAPHRPVGLESWIRGLRPWGREVWVRAGVASARLVLPLFEAKQIDDPRVHNAIEAAERWLDDDTDKAIEDAYEAAQMAQGLLRERFDDPAGFMASVTASAEMFRESRAAVQAALVVVEDDDRALTHAVMAGVAARERIALGETPLPVGRPSPLHIRAAEADRLGQLPELATESATRRVREAICAALSKWINEERGPE